LFSGYHCYQNIIIPLKNANVKVMTQIALLIYKYSEKILWKITNNMVMKGTQKFRGLNCLERYKDVRISYR